MLGALVAATARAQSPAPITLDNRASFEGYYAHYRLDARGDATRANGFGGRLMWYPGSGEPRAAWLAPRIGLGAFAEYAPEQEAGFTLLHAGLQGDVSLLPRPLFGRIDPMVGLGVGALRTNGVDLFGDREVNGGVAFSIAGMPSLRLPTADHAVTTFALSPALGARVAAFRGVALRADVRDLVTFRSGTKHNRQLSIGVSLGV
jgi:hypothetical protein